MLDSEIDKRCNRTQLLLSQLRDGLEKLKVEPWKPNEPVKLWEPRRPINFEFLTAVQKSLEETYAAVIELKYEHERGFFMVHWPEEKEETIE